MSGGYNQTLQDAIDVWGEDLQRDVAIEELSELTTELAREQRGTGDAEDVIEEIADAYIMLDQLSYIYGVDAVESERNIKINALRDRIDDVRHQRSELADE